MSKPLLDDEWGTDGLTAALIIKHKRLRIAYAIAFIVLAPLWGILLNYIEENRLIDLNIGGLFFTVSGLLLTAYAVLVFKRILVIVLYVLISFLSSLGVMVLVIKYFNLNQNTLPLLCFLSGLIVVVLSLLIPIRYKRP